MKIKFFLLPLVLIAAGCSPKIEQRRLNVFEQVSCNLEAVNGPNRAIFGGARIFQAFGIKRKCADEGYGLSDGEVSMSEINAISAACYATDKAYRKEVLDSILELGGKIVSSSPLERTVSVYRKNTLQPGNTCIGREYFVEAPEKVFKQVGVVQQSRSVSK